MKLWKSFRCSAPLAGWLLFAGAVSGLQAQSVDTVAPVQVAALNPGSENPGPGQPDGGVLAGVSSSVAELPDAPQPALMGSFVEPSDGAAYFPELKDKHPVIIPPKDPVSAQPPVAPLHWKYIPAGYAYQKVTQGDKVYIGLRDLYSVGEFGAIILSAGWEQLNNSEPNYGTDRGAFGERLGAAGIRETTQDIFTDAVFSPLFREDPRFFAEGPNHNFFNRAFHAVGRVFITRTDNGGHTFNSALIAGYAASTALTPLYYPHINRNWKDAMSTFGGGLGGAALGFEVDEFADPILQALHLEKRP